TRSVRPLLPRPPRSIPPPYTTLFRSDEVHREVLVALRERERDHAHAVLEALEVALAVEGLERVARVVLEGPEERLEAELLRVGRSEEHTSELQSRENLVCRLLLEKKK